MGEWVEPKVRHRSDRGVHRRADSDPRFVDHLREPGTKTCEVFMWHRTDEDAGTRLSLGAREFLETSQGDVGEIRAGPWSIYVPFLNEFVNLAHRREGRRWGGAVLNFVGLAVHTGACRGEECWGGWSLARSPCGLRSLPTCDNSDEKERESLSDCSHYVD